MWANNERKNESKDRNNGINKERRIQHRDIETGTKKEKMG